MRILLFLLLFAATSVWAEETPPQILCTTFPVYQVTRNVVKDRKGVAVNLLLPATLGCPHSYSLTPQDLQRLSRADILVINGLGLEAFLGAALKGAGKTCELIDSTAGIGDLLAYGGKSSCDQHNHQGHAHHGESCKANWNPHLFASPRLLAKMTGTIAASLARLDPAGAVLYKRNGERYAASLAKLAAEFAALGKRLVNKRIVTQHGVFDYLARDMGLEVVAVVSAHGSDAPSASEMVKLIKIIRTKKVGAVFTEPQYPGKVGETLAREAGVRTAALDPGATGPRDAPLTYYERVMKKNLATLADALGVKTP